MMTWIRAALVLALLLAGVDTAKAQPNERVHAPSAQIADVLPAIVRLKLRSGPHFTGIIVSEQGHVLSLSHSSPGDEREFVLSTGETAEGTCLGFSDEWKIGLYQLQADRRWSFVELGTTSNQEVGQKVYNVSYFQPKYATALVDPVENAELLSQRWQDPNPKYAPLPRIEDSSVTATDPAHWFETDHTNGILDFGACTISEEGKLLGIVTNSNDWNQSSTAADVIRDLLGALMDGRNLDWRRYPPKDGTYFHQLGGGEDVGKLGSVPAAGIPQWNAPAQAVQLAIAKKAARRSTVHLRRIEANLEQGETWSWSGVVVSPYGHIVSCAHTRHAAGQTIDVIFADGKQAKAAVMATNPISDTSILKIEGKGPWQFAELGSSAELLPRQPVVVAGYPTPRTKNATARADLVLAELAIQETRYVCWGPLLFVDLSLEVEGGTSGGGVFNHLGQLVAINQGGGNTRAELLRAEWSEHLK